MKSNNYFIGVSWFILSLVISVLNDSISKYAGLHLPSMEITFFRFFFGTLILFPLILLKGSCSIIPQNIGVQIARGVLLFLGMSSWAYGLTVAPISLATVISFTIPLFFLVLAKFFLDEEITWQKWGATLIGFLGIFVTLEPTAEFDPSLFLFIFAAILFAGLDILNKKFVLKETMLTMLFYSASVTTILSLGPALYVWETPTYEELGLLFILGIGANFILFCLLKAFAIAEATSLAPFRYLELFFSVIAGSMFFNETPQATIWIGTLIIIPSTLFIAYNSAKK